MRKSILLLAIVGFMVPNFFVLGQSISIPEYIAPPPEASGLTSQVATSINYYNGIASISIPVYNVQSKDISFPITLDYTGANGIRVAEDANWVGLGWSLNCTGVITRQIRGKDDLYDYWFGPSEWLPDDPASNSYQKSQCGGGTYTQTFSEQPPYAYLIYDNICSGVSNPPNLLVNGNREYIQMNYDGSSYYDYSSDIYTISVPGFSGKFMFDSNKNPVFLKPNGHQIDWFQEGGFTYWELTTNEGVRYLFKNLTYTKTQTQHSDGGGSVSSNDIISAWNLTEIISPNGATITFQYDDYGFSTSERMRRIPALSEKHGLQSCSAVPTYPSTTEFLTTPNYLEEIHFNNGKLIFIRDTRDDLYNGERLAEIKLYNKNNDGSFGLKETFLFDNNHYFNSSSTSYSYHSQIPVYDQEDRKRLKLEKFYVASGSEIINEHTFEYNSLSLPVKSSFSVDHWGFYNGYSNNTFIPTDAFMNFTGANRNPNSSKVAAGMLQTIHYPTGGKIDFDFISTSVAAGFNRPGVIIERISEYDPLSNSTVIQRFEYLGATPDHFPPVYRIHKAKISEECLCWYAGWGRYDECSDNTQNYYLSSETIFPFNEGAMGNLVGFNKVTKYLGENGEYGKSEYYFKNEQMQARAQYVSTPSQTADFYYEPSPGTRNFYDYEAEYYNKRTNGRLERQIDYEDGAGKVKEIEYTYNVIENLIWNGYAIRSKDHSSLVAAAFYWYGIPVVWNQLIETTETIYSPNQEDLVKQVGYTYESVPQHYQILSKSLEYNTGKFEEQLYKYPHDYSSPSIPIQKLMDKNILVPVEKTKWVDGKLVAGTATRYSYHTSYDLVLPQIVYQLETDGTLSSLSVSTNGITFDPNYKPRLTFSAYDARGNPISIRKEDDLSSAFIWGYIDTYPIAKAVNALPTQIAYTSFESEDSKGGWTYEGENDDCEENCDVSCTNAAAISCASQCSSSCGGNTSCYNSCYSSCSQGIYGTCMTSCTNGCASSSPISASQSKTGTRSFKGPSISKSSLPSGYYTVSYWAKKSGTSNGTVTISGTATTVSSADWQYYEFTTSSAVTSISISLSGVYIDELRLFPKGAQMTSYTYKPLVGMTSSSGPDGSITYYEYDSFGRLQFVRDVDRNILQSYDYNYKH